MNLQIEMEKIIKGLNVKPRLMLHCCCAPCASYVTEYLKEHFELYLLYYNPNIAPYEEHELRKEELKRMAEHFSVKFLALGWDNDIFEEKIKGLENEPEGGSRCDICFRLRLETTAKLAKEYNCEYFTTTLSISPLKNSKKLYEIGKSISENYLPSDFKKKNGYKRSVEISNELGLYRQDYCGCIYSIRK